MTAPAADGALWRAVEQVGAMAAALGHLQGDDLAAAAELVAAVAARAGARGDSASARAAVALLDVAGAAPWQSSSASRRAMVAVLELLDALDALRVADAAAATRLEAWLLGSLLGHGGAA